MSERAEVQCPKCWASLDPEELRPHLSSHLFYHPFRCGHCQSIFASEEKLWTHAHDRHCLPIQVERDEQVSAPAGPPAARNLPTAPPRASSAVPSVSKGKDSNKSSTNPTTTHSLTTLSGRSSGGQLKIEKCSICQLLVPVKTKVQHVRDHVTRIRAGKEASPHADLSPELLYKRLQGDCFPETVWNRDKGVKRSRDSSPIYTSEEDEPPVKEQKTKHQYFKCQKCLEWVYGAQKTRHCKKHVRELMKKKGLSPDGNEEDIESIAIAKRDRWFPNTNWKPSSTPSPSKKRAGADNCVLCDDGESGGKKRRSSGCCEEDEASCCRRSQMWRHPFACSLWGHPTAVRHPDFCCDSDEIKPHHHCHHK